LDKRFLAKIPVLEPDCTLSAHLIGVANLLQESIISHVAFGRTVENDGKKILLLHFFKRDELIKETAKAEFRLFITEDDYITQKLDCQPRNWLTGSMDNIIITTSYYDKNRKFQWCNWTQKTFLADEDTIFAIQEIAGKDDTPLSAIQKLQDRIKKNRLSKKHEVIEKRIDARMEQIGELPEDILDWLDTAVFTEPEERYIFYEYKAKRKTQRGL